MKIFNHFLFLALILCGCSAPNKVIENDASKKNSDEQKISESIPHRSTGCICVELWLPVCGENGKTYSNACFAKCAHVNYSQGSCEKHISQ